MQKPRRKAKLCSRCLHRGQQQCTWPGAKCPVAVGGCISIWISAKVLPVRGCEGGGCRSFQRGAAAPHTSHGGVAMRLRRGRGPLCGHHSSHLMVGWMVSSGPRPWMGDRGPHGHPTALDPDMSLSPSSPIPSPCCQPDLTPSQQPLGLTPQE